MYVSLGTLKRAAACLVIAGSTLFAGPIDDIKGALTGPIGNSYKEALSNLEKEDTMEGKQHLTKMHEMLNNVDERFRTVESGLEGIDPKLKTLWSDWYRLEKEVLVTAGTLNGQIGRTNYKSSLSDLKSRWEKFISEMPKVYTALGDYGKIEQKFQSLCGSCR
jgi:hypothetical protein